MRPSETGPAPSAVCVPLEEALARPRGTREPRRVEGIWRTGISAGKESRTAGWIRRPDSGLGPAEFHGQKGIGGPPSALSFPGASGLRQVGPALDNAAERPATHTENGLSAA